MSALNYAKRIDAIPVVANAGDRAALFPTPDTNQRVYRLDTLTIERYTSGGAWVTEFQGLGQLVLSGTGSPEGVVTATVGVQYQQTDGANGSVLWVKNSGAGNTGWALLLTNGMGVAGIAGGTNFAVLSKLILGAATGSADDTALLIARVMAGALGGGGPFSAHAIRDETTMNSSVGGGTYASSDAVATYNGVQNYGHLVGHQSRPQFNGSGVLTEMAGFWDLSTNTGVGTITSRYGLYVFNLAGTGPVTNQYGVYVDFLDRGTTKNYAFYSTGPTKSSFGGSLNLGTTLRTGLVETPDSSVGILVGNTDLTSAAQAGINSSPVASAAATSIWGMIAKAAAATATIVNGYGLNILTATKTTGSIATNYGLKIEDQTAGTTNYAVKTGLGRIQFGDLMYGLLMNRTSVVFGASPYTAVANDYALNVSAGAGAVTIVLPPAASNNGRVYVITKIDNTTNPVTIDANAAESINGALTYVLGVIDQSVTIHCDGASWDVIASHGINRQTVDGWYQDNVAASQTNIELNRGPGRWHAARPCYLVGVSVKSTLARTAGTLTIKIYNNTGLAGAAGSQLGTITAVLDGTNTSFKATLQRRMVDAIAAGTELYATITTDGAWTPTTAGVRVDLEVET